MLATQTNYRAKLYKLEEDYSKSYFVNDSLAASSRQALIEHMHAGEPKFNDHIYNSFQYIIDRYNETNLTLDQLKRFTNVNAENLSNADDNSFNEAIGYVQKLHNIDLSKVIEVRLDSFQSNSSEGECVSCGPERHRIYYSLESNQVVSIDLLCHELGHASDFTFKRALNDDRLLFNHNSLNEAVAYYTQYSYLRAHGTEQQRKAAILPFFHGHLMYLAVYYCLDNKVQFETADLQQMVDDAIFNDYAEIYGRTRLVDLISEARKQHKVLANILLHIMGHRLGIPFALAMLADKDLDVRELSTANMLSANLKEIVESASPLLQTALSKFKENAIAFIGPN